MPSSATKKTASGRKDWRQIPGRAVAVLVLVLLVIGVIAWRTKSPSLTTLQAGGRMYHLEVAKTPAEQTLGLGDRLSMPTDHGMLFVMSAQRRWCFWMKDMRFSLDIIWVDKQHRVSQLAAEIAPETYPQQYCATGAYVIELNAGQAYKANIYPGQSLTF